MPISTERGTTGAMILGPGTFRYAPRGGPAVEEQFHALMVRCNPADWAKLVPIEKAEKIKDRGLVEMGRHMLATAVRHCYQGTSQASRNPQALIPPRGAFAADIDSREHAERLVSFSDPVALVFNFTEQKHLYEKKK